MDNLTSIRQFTTFQSGLGKRAGILSLEATKMSTRILSVFNLLKRVGFAILFLGGSAIAQEVIWVRNGETANSHFGAAIYPLGDQNEDGCTDWMVWSVGGFFEETDRVEFFRGGETPSQVPYLLFHPRLFPVELYMLNVRTIGDFDGDGFEDWVIGYTSNEFDSVMFELYKGGVESDTIAEASLSVAFDFSTDRVGRIGDHNGDGYADIYFYHGDNSDVTHVYFGNSSWELSEDLTNQGEPIGSGNGNPQPDVFGDFNGDHFDDYVARTGGNTYFYFGSAEPDTIPDLIWEGNFAFPATLSADLNGDGAKDLAVSRDPRTIHVHLGGSEISSVPTFELDYQDCNNTAQSISTSGDYNSDGFEDLVVVNHNCDNGFGRLSLWLGGFWLNPDPVIEITGLSVPPFNDVPIWRAIGLGDVNGDSIDDLAVACEGEILDGRRGRVVILSGDTSLHVDANDGLPLARDFSMTIYPNPANGYVRLEFAGISPHYSSDLNIYNLLGQRVDHLFMPIGTSTLSYNVAGLTSGIYLVQAQNSTMIQTQKLVVLK